MNKGRKKILVFIDWFIPGYKSGGPVRSCLNMINALGAEYDFHVVTRDCDYCESKPYPGVESNTWNVTDNIKVWYFSSGKLKWTGIRKVLREVRPDIIYMNGLYSWYFTIIPLLLSRKLKVKKIVAVRGMLASGALAIKKYKKKIFLHSSLLTGLFRDVIFHVTDKEEAWQVSGIFGKAADVMVAPNLISAQKTEKPLKRKDESGEVRFVTIARVAPEKNIDYALEVLAEAAAMLPQSPVRYDLYGPLYHRGYWELCNAVINRFPPNISFFYHEGIHPSEVHAKLAESHFMLLPTRGENFGHIIMEALSSACPVLISDKTIWKGLEKENAGWEIPLADKAGFILVLKHCIGMKNEEYRKWSEGAYSYAGKYLAGSSALEQNRKLFSS